MKKIMFNDRYGLTDAVLQGSKTQTRRIVPNQLFTLQWDIRDNTLVSENENGDFIDIRESKFNQFKLGEIVAVAQAYNDFYDDTYNPTLFPNGKGWTNKMFVRPDLMPHQIRITHVRIERLQDISDEDCIKEGIINIPETGRYYFEDTKKGCGHYFTTLREAYAALIDKVNGRGTWERNPYVFSYEFQLIK